MLLLINNKLFLCAATPLKTRKYFMSIYFSTRQCLSIFPSLMFMTPFFYASSGAVISSHFLFNISFLFEFIFILMQISNHSPFAFSERENNTSSEITLYGNWFFNVYFCIYLLPTLYGTGTGTGTTPDYNCIQNYGENRFYENWWWKVEEEVMFTLENEFPSVN